MDPKDPKIQFAVRLPRSIASKIRTDAKRHDVSLDDVQKMMIEDFYSTWTDDERAKIFARLPRKCSGAPMKARAAR